MAIPNSEIASALERLADLLDIEDADAFRIRACRNTARPFCNHLLQLRH